MAQRIHVGSTLMGMAMGAGATLLIAAAAKPAAAPQAVATPPPASAGRYQIATAARDGYTCAYIVDQNTGKVAVVSENASPSMAAPQWGD